MATRTERGDVSAPPELSRHAQIVRGIALGVPAWLLAAVWSALLDRWLAVAGAIIGALGLLPAIPPAEGLRRGVAVVFLTTNVGAVLLSAADSGGTAAPILVVLVPLVLLAAQLVGPRAGVATGVGAAIGVLLLFFVELSGVEVGGSVGPERVAAFSVALAISMALGVLSYRALAAERTTAQLQAEEARSSRDALQRQALAKSSFYATMSHEVRTPLGGLIGLLTALEGTELREDQREIVALMRTSGEALRLIVNDMLDLEAIERGALRIEAGVVEPRGLVEDLAALHHAAATARGLRIEVQLGPLPGALVGDGLRLRQVVQNLLTNALKFTERGTITLRAKHEHGVLSIEVADTGRGISADRLASIFLPFERADPTLARRYGGTGLGLAIVKQLVDAMRGEVSVESEVGRGTTFRVELPLTEATRQSRVALEAGSTRRALDAPSVFGGASGRFRGLRALVVDDDRVNRIATALVLRRLGVEAVEVDSHARALAEVDGSRFDLAFLDQHMPDGLGTDLAHQLCARPHVPVLVMLSASALAEDRTATKAAGVPEFLAKPLELEALIGVLDRVPRTAAPAKEDVVRIPPQRSRTGSAEIAANLAGELDPGRLAELRELAGDRAQFEGLMRTFLDQLEETIVELEELTRAPDASNTRKIAHRIKGGAANVGAAALVQAARKVEDELPKGSSAAPAAASARALIDASRRANRAIRALLGS